MLFFSSCSFDSRSSSARNLRFVSVVLTQKAGKLIHSDVHKLKFLYNIHFSLYADLPRYHKIKLFTYVPGWQIFWNIHHRIVSYIHRKAGKQAWRETNKWKLRGVHGRHIFDNEIHSFDRKISHKSHIDIATATTLELSVHSLHILRENRGKNQPLHWKNNEPAIERPLRKPLKCLFVNKPLDFRQQCAHFAAPWHLIGYIFAFSLVEIFLYSLIWLDELAKKIQHGGWKCGERTHGKTEEKSKEKGSCKA